MSLFQRQLRPPAILSDQAVERYLEAVRAEISVDPLFRRRLRGTVVNRFVAEREGRMGAMPRRRMGALGRAVLYASFVLSISVTSAMAASQGAVPGDAFYPLKIQIERLRLQALPEHVHDDLAAHALGERIHELGVLAERGDWARVTSQAAAVESEYRHYLETVDADGSSDRYLVVLNALLERLPDRAQLAIEDVLDGVEAAESGASDRGSANGQGQGPGSANEGRGSGPVNQGGGTGGSGDGGASGAAATDPATPEPTAKPSRPARPEPTPRATKVPRPSAEPTPSASDAAEPEAGDEDEFEPADD